MRPVSFATVCAVVFLLVAVTVPGRVEAFDKKPPFVDYVRAAYYGHDLRDPVILKAYWREKNYKPGPPGRPEPQPQQRRAVRQYHYAAPAYDPEWEREWEKNRRKREEEARKAAKEEAKRAAERRKEMERRRREQLQEQIRQNKDERAIRESKALEGLSAFDRQATKILANLDGLLNDMKETGVPVEPSDFEGNVDRLVGKTVTVTFKSGATDPRTKGRSLRARSPYTIQRLMRANRLGIEGKGNDLWIVVSYDRPTGGGIGTWSFPYDAVDEFTEI